MKIGNGNRKLRERRKLRAVFGRAKKLGVAFGKAETLGWRKLCWDHGEHEKLVMRRRRTPRLD